MALETYSDLKTEIASYIARSDVTSSSDVVDSFIDLAEAKLNKSLRVFEMLEDFSDSTVSGQDYLDLPSDFIKFYSVQYEGTPKELKYYPRQSFVKYNDAGKPKGFTLGQSTVKQMVFNKIPDNDYPVTGVYYKKLTALSDSNTSNWLLDTYPELYLNASLYYAFKRYRSPLAADYKALTEADIEMLNKEAEEIQTGGGGMNIMIAGTTP